MSDPVSSIKDVDLDNAVRFWRGQLTKADKAEAKWRKRAKKVLKRYRDDRGQEDGDNRARRFNILWANTEILKPTSYSQAPIPEVRRRYRDQDPVGRAAAEIIERALSFSSDDYDIDLTLEQVRDDFLLVGRGCVRVRLSGDVITRAVEKFQVTGTDGQPTDVFMSEGERVFEPDFRDDGTPFLDDIGEQRVFCEYVPWEDVRFSPAKRWDQVWWVAYRHKWTRDDLIEEFGDKGRDIKLTLTEGNEDESGKDPDDDFRRAEVWEFWNKLERERVWIASGHNEVIRTDDDPLDLEDFFDMPQPIYAVGTTDTMVPVPEFCQYQDQADELDKITGRIDTLIEALKVKGLYQSVSDAVQRMMEADEPMMIPLEGNVGPDFDIRRLIMFYPVEVIAQVLLGLYQQRDTLKGEIFELTGLSDVIRGSSDAEETATAQRIKGNFAGVRLSPRQKPIQRLARNIFRMKGELIAEHITQENLSAMTGIQVPDEVMELLRDDKTRSMRIDIETDSTIRPDQEREQAEATSFMEAMATYLTAIGPIIQEAPETAPMLLESLKATARRFKFGREFEDKIDEAIEGLMQRISNPQPQADPEGEKAQREMELEQQKFQHQRQIDIEELKGKFLLQRTELEGSMRLKAAEIEAKAVQQAQNRAVSVQRDNNGRVTGVAAA